MHLLPCVNGPPPQRILVVTPTWVGDFVMATPFLRALRHAHPAAHIALLVDPNLRDLVAGGPWMNETILLPPRRRCVPWAKEFRSCIRELRARRYDWTVLLPNSFRSALMARLTGANRRIGYARDGRGWLLTDTLIPANRSWRGFRPMPLVDYYADLAVALGCTRPNPRLELFPTTLDEEGLASKSAGVGAILRSPLVVISPGARYGAAKCWFPDRFAAVADRLIRDHAATVVITCGPGEEPMVREIRTAMREPALVFDDPRLTLGELKVLISRSDLLICNDAGLRHFARAFNVPVVTVFGPTHPEWTRTSYAQERIVRIDVDCGPCQRRVCPLGHRQCMTGVTVDAVYEAAVALLEGRRISLTVSAQPRSV